MPFNVIMFGFDSLSRNAWMRKLPKSYEYMTKHLGADVLELYNIIGDGTPQALIPVLLICFLLSRKKKHIKWMVALLTRYFRFKSF